MERGPGGYLFSFPPPVSGMRLSTADVEIALWFIFSQYFNFPLCDSPECLSLYEIWIDLVA